MRQLAVTVQWSDAEARVWRVGNTLCATFRSIVPDYGGWLPVETFRIPEREREWDIMRHARDMYTGDTFTLTHV